MSRLPASLIEPLAMAVALAGDDSWAPRFEMAKASNCYRGSTKKAKRVRRLSRASRVAQLKAGRYRK